MKIVLWGLMITCAVADKPQTCERICHRVYIEVVRECKGNDDCKAAALRTHEQCIATLCAGAGA